jgi:hypothetical protein
MKQITLAIDKIEVKTFELNVLIDFFPDSPKCCGGFIDTIHCSRDGENTTKEKPTHLSLSHRH